MKQWPARGPAQWSWGAEGGPGVGVRRGGRFGGSCCLSGQGRGVAGGHPMVTAPRAQAAEGGSW